MSHWADYHKERFGWTTWEGPWGFLMFHVAHPNLFLNDIYVAPNMRRQILVRKYVQELTEHGKSLGCTSLITQVVLGTNRASDMLKLNLYYGFELNSANNGIIQLRKSI